MPWKCVFVGIFVWINKFPELCGICLPATQDTFGSIGGEVLTLIYQCVIRKCKEIVYYLTNFVQKKGMKLLMEFLTRKPNMGLYRHLVHFGNLCSVEDEMKWWGHHQHPSLSPKAMKSLQPSWESNLELWLEPAMLSSKPRAAE